MTNSINRVNSLVAYTTNTWVSPLATLRLVGPAYHAGLQLVKGNEDGRIFPERVSSADVVVIQRDFPRHSEAYREITARARREAKPILYDLDDLLLELPEDHPDRFSHYYSEALLAMVAAISQADMVTASTPALCSYLRPFNANVLLLPNYLDDHLWKLQTPPAGSSANGPVSIGYMGGDSHLPDLQMVTPALLNILDHFPGQVSLFFLGAKPPDELLRRPDVVWSPAETYVYADFAARFGEHGCDIYIAPLQDNRFNRCKSPIKYLEYSALGAPGVYSALDAYGDIVEHGKNGFLASSLLEWEQHLRRLVEDPGLRQEMGMNAQETVRRCGLLSEHAWQWREAYEQAQEAAHQAGTPPEAGQLAVMSSVLQQAQSWQDHLKIRGQALETSLAEKERAAQAMQEQFTKANQRLYEIQSSTAWKLVQRLWGVRLALAPAGSPQARLLDRLRRSRTVKRTRPPESQSQESPHTEQNPETPAVAQEPGPKIGMPPTLEFDADLHELGGQIVAQRPARPDVIILPIMDWGTRVQRPQQIALRFARSGRRVFYLHTSFRPDGISLRPVQDNLFEVQLPAAHPANLYFDPMSPELAGELLETLGVLRGSFGIIAAVCLVDLPFWSPLALRLRDAFGWKVVYDCMDYHRGFSTDRGQVAEQDEMLARESDLVLVTSRFLLDQKRAQNPNTIRVPNGTEFEHFRFPPSGAPEPLRQLSCPIIGYYGAIADWFDTNLVAGLAHSRPDWNFVLIGSTLYADLAPLQGLENVHLLGEIPYAELPAYLHAFNVAAIPFKKNPLTDATNPVKMFEYLSAGKPVVATDLDELRQYSDLVRLARTSEQWLEALESALADDAPERIRQRLDFARDNTWERRFEQIEASLIKLYPLASIVILADSDPDYTRLCLETLFTKTVYPNYEIILLGDVSDDRAAEFQNELSSQHANLRLILDDHGHNQAGSFNQGAAAARGEFLAFLTSDAVVTRGWLISLWRCLQKAGVGLAGALTNSPENSNRTLVSYQSLDQMAALAEKYTSDHLGQTFEVETLSLSCAGVRKAVFEEVGLLDETCEDGMHAAADYARRMKARGYSVVCARDSYVHLWSASDS
jgi:glycosyltransferase involved in cell wall biosynthesis